MCNACAAMCTCCGKLTKWIVIGLIIFVVVSIVTSCIVLLGPDETSPTSPSPAVAMDLLQNSIIFKAIGTSAKPMST
ncbi:hypothetical protein DAPPUDRAFT_299857 [Daphnia pulex]|uniref:Uncharacterized protein n=1 Tax=Daphnia pulex TaxID=6669 RepID=E9FSB1_DAPPU|nr:hypothetical protein DAPPUDRAFT_299857 [Daphnia pulex]|eukprot:EFX90350.1 hypothetical protein DAPPUDRAFT_299857 [Daphnia pulex]